MSAVIVACLATREDAQAARAAVEAGSVGERLALVLDAGGGGASVAALRDGAVTDLVRLAAERGIPVHVVAPPDASLPATLDRAPRHDAMIEAFRALLPMEARAFRGHVSLPARLDYLAPLRQFVAEIVASHHGEPAAFQVEILADELCLNAVENSPNWTCLYDVAVVCEGHELAIEVTNSVDPGADPERAMQGRLESFDDSGGYLGERGRGLFLIARIADGLQIRSLPGDRIRVAATKRLRVASPAAPPETSTPA